jgi:peptidyl-prolyl cis-trans isomerase A (cyclophilin A)
MRIYKPIIIAILFFCCFFVSIAADSLNPMIVMKTSLGDITLELFPAKAPVTAGNFMKYVKESRFNEALFYRVVRADNQPKNPVKIAVIQGGLGDNEAQMLPPISHETTKQTGILHEDGVISMARWHPGTATSEFFICVGKQSELDFGGKRNPDGQGFAAFGKVVQGMDVVHKIHQHRTEGQYLSPIIKITAVEMVKKD